MVSCGYLAMLLIMSYNICVLAAVLLGMTSGNVVVYILKQKAKLAELSCATFLAA